jgi:hypothetical protein
MKPVKFPEIPCSRRKIPCSVEKIPCSPRKNSLFFQEQGIGLQRIEIAKKFPVLRTEGNLTITHWNYSGIGAARTRNWPEKFPVIFCLRVCPETLGWIAEFSEHEPN